MICKNSHAFSTYSLRLLPGQDLKQELFALVKSEGLQAAVVLSSVGSLQVARLRLANAKETRTFPGPFEIVSLTGTLSQDGLHLHMSLSDSAGATIGGHLVDGCLVHTTCELVVLEQGDIVYSREVDPSTGYLELRVRPR